MEILASDRPLILVRIGEITLKKLNRYKFEAQLIYNMRYRLKSMGKIRIEKQEGRIVVEVPENHQTQDLITNLKDVFGIVSLSPLTIVQGGREDDLFAAITVALDSLMADGKSRTFKIETKRINKSFPLRSYDVSSEGGYRLLERFGGRLSVDVRNPDVTLWIEIRDSFFLYYEIVPGPRGLPVGMSGNGMLLLSGGIDSPVAGYKMASRGMTLESIYFHTYPYTGDEVVDKVRRLGRIMTRFTNRMFLHIVDFTAIQLEIQSQCPEDMITIVMRRMMMRIAERLAQKRRCKSLITGESLGQVASQTQEALVTTDEVVSCPVYRPLIGDDKDDTVRLARSIGTFDTSILPYADCCTVFVSKSPKTHPSLDAAKDAEANLDIEALVTYGLEHITSEHLLFHVTM